MSDKEYSLLLACCDYDLHVQRHDAHDHASWAHDANDDVPQNVGLVQTRIQV